MAGSWVPHSPCLVLRLRCPLSLSAGGEAWPSCVSVPPARPAAARVPPPVPWKRVERPHAMQPSLAAARSRYSIVASASRPPPAPPCVPEGWISLRADRLLATRSATVLTVPSSRPAWARAAQSSWPEATARHPTLAGPVAPASQRPACGRQGTLPAARRGVGEASGGLHNPEGACPTGRWQKSL
jgi:hypothetical protein